MAYSVTRDARRVIVTLIWFVVFRSNIADSPIRAVALRFLWPWGRGNRATGRPAPGWRRDRLLLWLHVRGPDTTLSRRIEDGAPIVGLIALAIIEIREHGGYRGI